MHSSGLFSDKAYCKVDLKCEISGSHMISDQSLLLSTVVLNDIGWKTTNRLQLQ